MPSKLWSCFAALAIVAQSALAADAAEAGASAIALVESGSIHATAFVVASDNGSTVLVTAAHALGCDGSGAGCDGKPRVVFPDRPAEELNAVVLRTGTTGTDRDLALLRVPRGNVPVFQIARASPRSLEVEAIGFSESAYQDRLTQGLRPLRRVGSVRDIRAAGDTVVHDVPTTPGFSGGPLIDRETNTVVGVVHGRESGSLLAIGPTALAAFLRDAGTTWERGKLSPARRYAAPRGPQDLPKNGARGFEAANAIERSGPIEATAVRAEAAYEDAANGGDATAAVRRGDLVWFGIGVGVDMEDAVRWYRTAAAGKSREGCEMLAYAYLTGRGVERNAKNALPCLNAVAEQHDGWAEKALGDAYFNGDGVDANGDTAISWYRRAADDGNAVAMRLLGVLLFGSGTASGREAALGWFERAARAGDPRGATALGLVYGSGPQRDPAKAIPYLRSAADVGDETAQLGLAMYYDNGGGGLAVDHALARAWAQRAADQGVGAAAAFLADAVARDGDAGAQARSRALIRQAAEDGDSASQFRLGIWYAKGDGVNRDPAEAVRWFGRAGNAGYAPALVRIGSAMMTGIGTDRDDRRAYGFFTLALKTGSADAESDGQARAGLATLRARMGQAEIARAETFATDLTHHLCTADVASLSFPMMQFCGTVR